MSISRKFQRSKSKYTLSQKIISAVTAAGFIMQGRLLSKTILIIILLKMVLLISGQTE